MTEKKRIRSTQGSLLRTVLFKRLKLATGLEVRPNSAISGPKPKLLTHGLSSFFEINPKRRKDGVNALNQLLLMFFRNCHRYI